jgi:hypothetical protein
MHHTGSVTVGRAAVTIGRASVTIGRASVTVRRPAGSAGFPAAFRGPASATPGALGLLVSTLGRSALARQCVVDLTLFGFSGILRADRPPVGQVIAYAGKQGAVPVGILAQQG